MFKHFRLLTIGIFLAIAIIPGMADLHAQIEYIEDKVRITPKNNVYDKSNPRDLNFVVHHPDTKIESLTLNGEEVEFGYFMFTGLDADGQSLELPETSKLDLKQDFLETLDLGEHTFKFNFTDGTVREFNLDVVDETTKKDYDLEIISFNVEHGDCVFINLPNKNILVDAAPGNMAKERVVPLLKEKGIEKIDYIFITHWHWDHVDGLQYFIKDFEGLNDQTGWVNADPGGFEVGEVYYNLSGDGEGGGESASGQDHFSPWFKVGNEFEIDGAKFKVLAAAQHDEDKYHEHSDVPGGRNNKSLSFRMEYNGFVYGHGGDVYQHAQRAALKEFGADTVKSHFYHGNHHFHGGLSREYLKTVDPYLFYTPAEEATYNRTAYVEGVMGEVVPYLEENSNRFIENLFAFEAGHTIIRANDPGDWEYETHYINQAQTTIPKSLGFSEPTDGTKFEVGESVNISIEVTDPAGQIDGVQLFASRELLAELNEAPYEYTWQNPEEGRYKLTAVGLDSEGNVVSTSREALITVGEAAAPDTLVHHWSFDADSGDYAANSVNVYGGNVDGATWTEGKYGNALSFDGSDDYVNVPHDSSLSFKKDFTIAAWIYLNDASGGGQVLQKGTNYALFEARDNSEMPANVFNDGSNWNILDYSISKSEFENQWRHIAFTYDGETAKNYIDGELDGTFNISGQMQINQDNLGIGTNSPWNTHFFNGKIDELAIYEFALPPSDIKKVYSNNLDEVTVETVTSVEQASDIPDKITLERNYPNPFNPSTQIDYSLPSTAVVKLVVYDMKGREVARLVNQQKQTAGQHSVTFDATGLASGLYVYRLQVGSKTFDRKMALIK